MVQRIALYDTKSARTLRGFATVSFHSPPQMTFIMKIK